MLMKKTKKLVGPYYEAEEEFKDTPEDNEWVKYSIYADLLDCKKLWTS